MIYRLSLDLGTNSIGWAQFPLDANGHVQGLKDGGVHIFDQGRDPKSLTSNAADRRSARSMRRNRDRKNLRKGALISALVKHDLMPAEKSQRQALAQLDPYQLRAEGLVRALSAYEFGRALFHLHQRRGFQSNRKSEGGDEGKIRQGAARLTQRLEEQGHQTYGQFLAGRRKNRQSTRLRLQGEGAKSLYEFYPTRDLIRAEFDTLFEHQQGFGLKEANPQAKAALESIFFRQRKLRAPLVGKCAFFGEEPRASKSMPTAQRFRLWSEVLNLRVRDDKQNERPLTKEEQDIAIAALLAAEKITFDSLKKKLKLALSYRFNLESARRKFLKGDQTAALFRKALKAEGTLNWDSLSLTQQDAIAELVMGEHDDAELIALLKVKYDLNETDAQIIAAQNPSPTRGHLSLKAMRKLITVFERDRLPYNEATQVAGLGHHSDRRTGQVWSQLPYYGEVLADAVSPTVAPEKAKNEEDRFGRFPNPTVHMVLNRLRKLVNALIDRDGPPAEIVIESGRELPLSAVGRKELEKRQKQNTEENDRRADVLRAMSERVTAANLLRLSLWEELAPDYLCVFSGQRIAKADLFDGSIEIEHILPYSRTLDDSRANKTLAILQMNREKAGKSPYEAFGEHSTYDYEAMLARAKTYLPPNKARRFAQGAMEKYQDENKWLQRQLTDTQYVARLAVRYLTPICSTYDGNNIPVWSSPGGLTAKIRYTLGLNEVLGKKGKKNRDDHRHHFIDACVLGLVDRGLLQQVGKLARRSFDITEQNEKLSDLISNALGGLAAPLRKDITRRAATIIIAHRPDHSTGGQLLQETAYGFVNKANPELTYDKREKSAQNVTLRVELMGDKFKSIEDLGKKIMSAKTAQRLYDLVYPEVENGTAFKDAIAMAVEKTGIRKVRIGLRETVEPIHVDGKITKGYSSGGNWAYDFYECPYDGFGAELINLRTANAENFIAPWKAKHPAARLLMRVFNGDLIEIDDPRSGKSGRNIFRIQKMTAGQITLCEPHEANAADRDKTEKLFFVLSPKRLMKLGIRKLHVSVLGEVRGRTKTP